MKYILILAFALFSNLTFAQGWEINVLNNINPSEPNSAIQKTVTNSVYPLAIAAPIGILATGFINKDKKLQQQGYKIIGTLMINTAISQAMKYSFKRMRPYNEYPDLIHPYNIENDSSFPSGHTSTAFALATSMSIQYKKWYIVIPSYVWACSVGYSRLYLGEHYPTDILAGAAIGIGSAYLSEWLNKKIFKK